MRKKLFVVLLLMCVSLFWGVYGMAPANAESAKKAEGGGKIDPLVSVRWAEDVLADYSEYDEFIADTTEPQVKVVFGAEGDVKDFKVLSLDLKDVDENGKPNFLVKELYALDRLKPARPLVLGLTFFGSIPHYGISYLDAEGATRRFAVVESGMDGSVLLSEF